MRLGFALVLFFTIGVSVGLVVVEPLLEKCGTVAAIAVGATAGAFAAWLTFALAKPLVENCLKKGSRL